MASFARSNNNYSNKATTSHSSKSKYHPYTYNSSSNNTLRNDKQADSNFSKHAGDFLIGKENLFTHNNNSNRKIISNNQTDRSLRPIEYNELNSNSNHDYQSYLMSANKRG
jgi:hypothetical protein